MFRYIATLLVCFFTTGLLAVAHAQDAQIQGQVLDTSGAGIAKALVRVVDQRAGTEAKAQTNDKGEYSVRGLPPGLYTLYAEAPGFSTAISDALTLTAGQAAVLDFALKVGSTSADIIVTAEKKSESIQDSPVPVTVINTKSLVETNQVLLRDYFGQVPGFNVVPNYVNTQIPAIRGITSGDNSTSTVGLVIDDIPFGTSTGPHGNVVPDFDPGDLAQIEVLRGPQGTLYGADSMGGLIKYVTTDPSTAGVSARLESGTSSVVNGAEPGYVFRGSVNVPIAHNFAGRASAFTRDEPGYINDPVRNVKGVNETHTFGGRLSSLWQITSEDSLKLTALYQHTKSNGLDEVDTLPGLSGLEQVSIPGVGTKKITAQAYGSIFKARFGRVDLTSLTGYSQLQSPDSLDFSFVFGPDVSTGAASYREGAGPGIKRFTQEVHTSNRFANKFDLQLGAFVDRETEGPGNFEVDAVNPTTGQFVSLYWRDDSEVSHYNEYSVFGNLTYNITERFNVQFGGRQSYIHSQNGADTQRGPFIGPIPAHTPAIATDESAFTYLATPQYRLGSDAMVYARFASGYRPGTPNLYTPGIPRSSDPDSTNNYEVGVKAGFFQHRLALDGSLYYIKWTGIQIEETSPVSEVVFYTNGAAAKSEGVELSVTAKPATGLSISSWFAYDDAALTEALPETTGLTGGPGSRLPFSTRFSGNLSLQQDFPVTHSIKGYVGVQGNYVGDQIGRFVAGPERQLYPDYGKVSLRGGVRWSSWALNAYANNAADTRAFVNGGIGYFYPVAKIYITPRTVGVNLVKTF